MLKVKVLFIFLLLTYLTKATSIFSPHCRNALYHTLYLNFELAEKELAIESKSDAKNIYIPYLENYIDFLKIILNETPEIVSNYEIKFRERYTKIDKSFETSSLKYRLMAELNLQSSIVYTKLNDRAKGFKYLFVSQKLISKHPEYNNKISELNKLKPAILLVNSYLPSFLKKLVPLQGNYKLAFEILDDYQKNVAPDSLLSLESKILTSFIYLQFKGNITEAYEFIKPNVKETNYNPLLSWAYILTCLRNGKLPEALNVIDELSKKIALEDFPFLFFLKGEINTYSQFNGIEEFKLFLKFYKGKNFIKTAWHKLSWNYFLADDSVNYNNCKSQVIIAGSAWNDSDMEALKEANESEQLNPYLLKSRLLFDGGFFNKAREILVSEQTLPSLKTERDRLEFIYRFARINHKTDDIISAKRYYSQIISFGKDKPYYFAANSALQLGIIYENENDIKNASFYYKLCMDINKYGYTSSIQAMAKAGLQRIKK